LQGFPLEESTWEPEENVACHELIAEFERKRSKVEKKEPSATSEKREEKQLHRIIGLTDSPGELHFLIKWKDHTADLVPAKEANVKLVQFSRPFYHWHAVQHTYIFFV
ncbi:chromo shadow domain protein, partial [Oesophagostomum dentatum]